MKILPFAPDQAGYGVDPDDGILATQLDGGSSRLEIVSQGNVSAVTASWVLSGEHFDILAGFHRSWCRTLESFLAPLAIDSSRVELYESSFIPNTWRITGKEGPITYVSAQLEAVPLDIYLDEKTDPGGALAMLYQEYGADYPLVLRGLEKLVNEDLPHE